MALIDEYKQAIQDVLDGRAKPAPKPSELPWSEDRAATMWAAAAAELLAEQAGGGSSGGGVLEISIDNDTGALNKTWQEIHDALASGKLCKVMEEYGGLHIVTDVYISSNPGGDITYGVSSSGIYASTDSANGYPVLG